MSDQDEISRLLAEAAAQTEAAPGKTQSSAPIESTGLEASEASAAKPEPSSIRGNPARLRGRNNSTLGIAWFNGSLHAAVFQRHKIALTWSCPTPVRTVAEFENVIDEALTQTKFTGAETFLILENEVFMHQAEDLPIFSESVLRNYIKNKIHRHEQQHGRVLWVVQPLITIKNEQSIIIHLLPRSFYDDLHRVLLKRHLDLTRILPLIVALQHELNRIPAAKNSTVIVAAEVGTSTSVLAGRVGGPLLFSRTILADINHEASRVAVEVNRSLLYTKQHFENAASSIWLMAQNGASATAEIKAKCGAGRKIMCLPATPIDWLQTAVKLSAQQPINLLSRYLKAKQRNKFIRGGFLIAIWLGLALMTSNLFHETNDWNQERSRLFSLRDRAPELQADRERLDLRNRTIERNQAFINRVTTDRLPPVPARLLGFVSALLPDSARLMEFNVRWDAEALSWTFQFNGSIEADDETARAIITSLQDEMVKSPLRIRFNETARVLAATPLVIPGAPEIQRFNLEGVLLEK